MGGQKSRHAAREERSPQDIWLDRVTCSLAPEIRARAEMSRSALGWVLPIRESTWQHGQRRFGNGLGLPMKRSQRDPQQRSR